MEGVYALIDFLLRGKGGGIHALLHFLAKVCLEQADAQIFSTPCGNLKVSVMCFLLIK